MYLYRAFDQEESNIDFFLSKTRDSKSSKCCLKKTLAFSHGSTPRVITVNKNLAYPIAIEELTEEKRCLKAYK